MLTRKAEASLCYLFSFGMIIGWAMLTWHHVETQSKLWAMDQRLQSLCQAVGAIPTDFRCLFINLAKHNSPAVLAAVAQQESRFRKDAVSKAGARGLMQFMPKTAAAYAVDANDPVSSIEGADRMLADLKKQFGNYGLAFAAYNWGSGNLKKWLGTKGAKESAVPEETRNYVLAMTGHPLRAWLGKTPPPIKGRIAKLEPELRL